mgnify:CR=1 FL=1
MIAVILSVCFLFLMYLLYKVLRLLFYRLLFFIKLYKLKRKNIILKFRKTFLFSRMKSDKPAVLVETDSNVYAVKLCGFLIKHTEVKFESPQMWKTQGAATIRGTKFFKEKLKPQKDLIIEIEPTIKNISIVYLFVPPASAYYKKEGAYFRYASYGEFVCKGYIHSGKSFIKLLKNETSKNNFEFDDRNKKTCQF